MLWPTLSVQTYLNNGNFMEKQFMIKSFEIIRPADIPYRLLSFQFFFENINSHILNLYHAAGMNLIYHITKTCYLFPQNEFYQLLKLQNTEEPHEEKYNWILMKGIFDENPKIEADIEIENEKILDLLQPDNHFNKKRLHLHRLPEADNEIVISDKSTIIFHHFLCKEVLINTTHNSPFINMIYLLSYTNFYHIINLWFNKENKLMPLP
jgi:hypothetical protein